MKKISNFSVFLFLLLIGPIMIFGVLHETYKVYKYAKYGIEKEIFIEKYVGSSRSGSKNLSPYEYLILVDDQFVFIKHERKFSAKQHIFVLTLAEYPNQFFLGKRGDSIFEIYRNSMHNNLQAYFGLLGSVLAILGGPYLFVWVMRTGSKNIAEIDLGKIGYKRK